MFRKFWRVVYPAFVLFASYLAIYIAAMLIYDAFFRSSFSDLNAFMLKWQDLVSSLALVLGGIVSFIIYRKDHVTPSDSIRSHPVYLVPVIICGVLASHGLSILVSLLGMTGVLGTYTQTEQMISTSGVLITILKSVILAPLAEEITFRGLVFRRMKEYTSFWPAALVSSLLFGLYHMNLMQGIFAFIYGLLLCAIYDRFKNLWAPIAMHAAANLISILIQVIGLSYPSIPVYILVMCITLAASAALLVLIRRSPVSQ